MLPKNNRGFVFVPLILIIFLVIVFLVSLYFYTQRTQSITNVKGVNSIKKISILPSSLPTPTSSPDPSPWKTYKNSQYNFEITYPKVGVVWHKEGVGPGECGFAIKEENNFITVDNFYKVKVIPFAASLEEYLVLQRAKNAYEIESLIDSGADEAVKLVRLKPDFEIAVGYPPLAYVKVLFKRGDKVFLMQEIVHNPNNAQGCVQPSVVDPTQFPDIAKQSWDITQSLKFF